MPTLIGADRRSVSVRMTSTITQTNQIKEKHFMATTVQNSNESRNLPVAQLQASTTNPRRRFDEHSLAELAFSFQAQGVLQPLLVRTIEDEKYEVIAGARRLRAAKLAALEEVPVRVVELSDAACVETQLVENIQRENAHPLEEAFAFHGLLHTDGLQYNIASLAAKTGKSPTFVATRLRLVELHPSIAEVFLADEIGVGHALEIAKLPQQEQQRAFDAAFHTAWRMTEDLGLPDSWTETTLAEVALEIR